MSQDPRRRLYNALSVVGVERLAELERTASRSKVRPEFRFWRWLRKQRQADTLTFEGFCGQLHRHPYINFKMTGGE